MKHRRDGGLRRIDFFIPRTSQYEVLHHFTRKLYEAFVRAGYTCRLLQGDEQFSVPLNDPPDLTVGFNGAPRNKEGQMFCDFQQVPHLAYLVDPPYHFLYLYSSPQIITSCDDRMGCKLLQMLGVERTLFSPHAVEAELVHNQMENSQFEVVLLATFIDFEKRRRDWRQKYHPIVCRSMDEAIEISFADPKISYVSAFDYVMENVQRLGGGKGFEEITLNDVLQDLEYYIKGRDRVALAQSVQDQPLHIFGGTIDTIGWKEYFEGKKRNFHIHPPVNFQQALEIMRKTKILLNPSFKNKEGAHERVFAGLASGALVITTESQYLMDRFKEGEEMVYYRHPHLESVQENVEKYLSDEEQRLAIVNQGRKKILQGETWDHRAAALAIELPPILEKMTVNL